VVVYQARQKTSALQRQQFIETLADSYPDVTQFREEWETVLGYLADQDAIIVLDEFPYLVEQDESLPSVLQAMFDHDLGDSATTIVLVGSSISMMEEAALLGNSPLYGRSSLKLDIGQLPFDAAMDLAGGQASSDKQVLTWGVFGGVPYYLEEVDPDRTLGENVQRTILSRHGTLHDEPDYVLRMELREPTRYFSILEGIAGGSTSRNDIAVGRNRRTWTDKHSVPLGEFGDGYVFCPPSVTRPAVSGISFASSSSAPDACRTERISIQ
jgi:hypothetical protein